MANTTYATLAEFQARVSDTTSTYLQQMLNAAANLIDNSTMRNVRGTELFTETAAGVVRYFDDDLSANGAVSIDDALTITAVTRAGTTIASTDYVLWPYNPGIGPYTKILFQASLTAVPLLVLNTSAYGYPYPRQGHQQIAVTGTWGYCTQANRPPEIKEATLIQAIRMYERQNLPATDVAQMVANPWRQLDPLVAEIMEPYRKCAYVG